MSDVISRKKAIDGIKECIVKETNDVPETDRFNYNVGLATAVQVISDLPSEEVDEEPEVVEPFDKGCKNCKYGRYNDHWNTFFCYHPDKCVYYTLWEPATEPERKNGEWIVDGHHIRCKLIPTNFCPNCGAEMRKEN